MRWLTTIPLVYREIPEFWERDAGLVCLGFRRLGIDAKFVAIGDAKVSHDHPLILATPRQMEDKDWWRQWGADGVVLWGTARNELMAKAIKESGARLVLHVDTDGLVSSRVDFWRHFVRCYEVFKDARRPAPAVLAGVKALLYHAFPKLYDEPVLRQCGYADLLTINSPLALQQFRRFALGFGCRGVAERMKLIPSPVSDNLAYDPTIPKKRQIIAAGRWKAYQKDAPRTMEVIQRVLSDALDYSAVLCGSGADKIERLRKRMPLEVQSRIHVMGYVERHKLVTLYQESQVMLVCSRAESLHLASVETLCCGGTVVGPARITPINYLANANSGTLAISRSARDLSDALLAEIAAWRSGRRDPVAVSRFWQERFLAPNYAKGVLNELAQG